MTMKADESADCASSSGNCFRTGVFFFVLFLGTRNRKMRYKKLGFRLVQDLAILSSTCTGWMAHITYVICVLSGSASSFASASALARPIEGARGISPCLFAANQEMHIATQHNNCEANQDTAKHSTTSVQPIRSEKTKQLRRDRPRSDALVFRAASASTVEYRLKNCALIGLFDAATWLPVPDSRN